MKKAWMAVLVILATFVNVSYVYSGMPQGFIWGSFGLWEHDTIKHVFKNHNWQLEGWLLHDRDLMKKFESEEIPESKKVVVMFKGIQGKPEDMYKCVVIGMISGQKRVRPFFVHCAQDPDYSERLDTIMMPNGSIAALNSINERLRDKHDSIEPGLAIDESYPASDMHGREREFILQYLQKTIEKALVAGEEPVLFCTLFSYNAEKTLALLKWAKDEFGLAVRTGIGGQLVRVSPETYFTLPYIDHVGIGDAEVILEPLLVGRKSFTKGYLQLAVGNHYAPFLYENYLALDDRLNEMSQFKFGPFSDFRQVAVESVRGCAWACQMGRACEMCSLESITSVPHFKPFPEYFAIENQLAERFGINWIFDVSNQFIPVMGKDKQEEWLRGLLAAKKKYARHEMSKYVYLTSNSISERTAPLIREAGIRLPYIGFDGWDVTTRKALNKPQTDPKKVLRLCRENDLYVRLGIVIGSGLNEQNIRELPQFAESIIGEFKSTILTWGNFLEIILPGSRVWYDLEDQAKKNSWQEVTGLYKFFYQNGYLTWPQQERMTELYIRLVQRADYDEVVAMRDKTIEVVRPYAVPITFRDGGHLEKT